MDPFPIGVSLHGCATRISNRGEEPWYKLNKYIYALNQVSWRWFTKFSSTFLSFRFTQTKKDYSLFSKGTDIAIAFFFVYVDDIIVEPSHQVISQIKQQLLQSFKLKDLGTLKYFLGLEIARSLKGIFTSQMKISFVFLRIHWFSWC